MNINNTGIFGFDVSFYQDDNGTPQQIDFYKMKEYGASFVVIKAGQDTYQDPDFQYNWREAKRAGLPRSSYWFGDKDADADAQARKYWSLIRDDPGEGFLIVDFEHGSWTDWHQLYDFLAELKRLTGLPSSRIGIYTGYYFWLQYGPKTQEALEWFGQFLLWLAWYADDPLEVRVPEPWSDIIPPVDPILWQKGTPAIGHEAGVESIEIDYNVFNGDADKFALVFNATPTTPPTGGDVTVLYYADLKPGLVSNVRTSPTQSAPIAVQIAGPITVSIVSEKTVAEGYNWYQINYPANGWIALTSSYTNFRPVPAPDAPVIRYHIDVVNDGSLIINDVPYEVG